MKDAGKDEAEEKRRRRERWPKFLPLDASTPNNSQNSDDSSRRRLVAGQGWPFSRATVDGYASSVSRGNLSQARRFDGLPVGCTSELKAKELPARRVVISLVADTSRLPTICQ